MAKLEYDSNGRLLFTEEMRKEYTILIPQMLPVHFGFFAKLLERSSSVVMASTPQPKDTSWIKAMSGWVQTYRAALYIRA